MASSASYFIAAPRLKVRTTTVTSGRTADGYFAYGNTSYFICGHSRLSNGHGSALWSSQIGHYLFMRHNVWNANNGDDGYEYNSITSTLGCYVRRVDEFVICLFGRNFFNVPTSVHYSNHGEVHKCVFSIIVPYLRILSRYTY